MPKRQFYDRWLILTTGLLLVGGLFMVGSSSTYFAMNFGKDPSALWLRHGVHLLAGACLLSLMLVIPYRRLDEFRSVFVLLTLCFAGLLLVLAMPSVAGARRWISFFGLFQLQPSELAKLVSVLFMAYVLSRKEENVNDLLRVTLPALGVVGGMALLVVIEPDLGSAVVPLLVACAMVFAAGLRWRYVLGLVGLGATAFAVAVWVEPYRWRRIIAFVDPWDDPFDSGYQLVQSFIAFGNGGITGTGLGQGQQKALFLPAAHTDFIFSIIGEEFGLIGSLTLLVAFVLLFWRGMRAAALAPDRFGFYLALGLTNLLVLQALINMCVCTGLLPTKGLPLPFISYGGSSLVVSMAAMGLLLNVSQHSN